jgi:ATP-dependent exoDNAse (exonuclease V) alpha subunit
MNLPLNAIEMAKLRLAAIKAADAEAAKSREIAILGDRKLELPSLTSHGWSYDSSVDWNEEQMQAINAAMAGKSFCLIGAAGTGKTTTEKGMVYSILKNNLVPMIRAGASTKWLLAGTPGIAMVSFTNMAVRQTAKNFSNDVTCVTIHKLLEFQPEYYEVTDATGGIIKKMQFVPGRHAGNPLPRELKIIIVDESSMVDCDLFALLVAALPNPSAVQFIFLGDLNQLPPVYGGPILGKKLLELPVIELTRVYRQALLSPIIRYALQMKDGLPTPVSGKVVEDNGEHGCVTIHPWSANLKWEDALLKAQNFCKAAIQTEAMDILQDIILCPYNVNFGVIELNLAIADYLGRQRKAVVHHVIAGFEEKYLAVGDKVLVDKQEAFITKIVKNGNYVGKHPADVTKYEIDRYGGLKKRADPMVIDMENPLGEVDDWDVDAILDAMQNDGITERKNQCSHRITVKFMNTHDKTSFDPEDEDLAQRELSSAGEVNEMLFGYCLTVHKSQGSEWRRVFLITHKSHAKMCSRELMYTAMTRAKEYLYILCEPDRVAISGTLSSAARKPRLKGNTLAEKLISLKERFDKEAREKATAAKAGVREEADED